MTEDTEQPMLDPSSSEALETTLWLINHNQIPTHLLACNLAPEALQALGSYAYQASAMMDNMTGGL